VSKPWEVIQGDVRKVLKGYPDNHFDAALGDPPYAYRFMGRAWDYSLPSPLLWMETLRVLKPGAHACFFGGPRTFHRLVCAIEDAGFLPCDLLMYLHAKGFPKSLDISKAIDREMGAKRTKVLGHKVGTHSANGSGVGGMAVNVKQTKVMVPITEAATDARRRWQGWGTALKPAYEPILLAMKGLEGTFAENVLKWGTGALAIDVCRVGSEGGSHKLSLKDGDTRSLHAYGDGLNGNWEKESAGGRWPANIALDEEAAEQLDAQSGNRKGMSGGGKHANGYAGGMFGAIDSTNTARHDEGGASRFFFTTKVSRAEREAGCYDLPSRSAAQQTGRKEGSQGLVNYEGRGGNNPRAGAAPLGEIHNTHTTLKAIELTRWLATLLLPPPRETPRRILVPFAGAGSEMIGALQAGWDEVIGIEREAEYVAIIQARITKGGVFSGLQDKRMRKRERERARSAPKEESSTAGIGMMSWSQPKRRSR
jgi:hypothetical protein